MFIFIFILWKQYIIVHCLSKLTLVAMPSIFIWWKWMFYTIVLYFSFISGKWMFLLFYTVVLKVENSKSWCRGPVCGGFHGCMHQCHHLASSWQCCMIVHFFIKVYVLYHQEKLLNVFKGTVSGENVLFSGSSKKLREKGTQLSPRKKNVFLRHFGYRQWYRVQ